jgi:hypothetical protein
MITYAFATGAIPLCTFAELGLGATGFPAMAVFVASSPVCALHANYSSNSVPARRWASTSTAASPASVASVQVEHVEITLQGGSVKADFNTLSELEVVMEFADRLLEKQADVPVCKVRPPLSPRPTLLFLYST